MAFTKFVEEKKRLEESRKVSVSLMKNLMDLLRDYVDSELSLSSDERTQVVSNMKIEQLGEDGNKTFEASSFYMENDEIKKEINITIEITSDMFVETLDGGMDEPMDLPDEEGEEEPTDEEETEEEEEEEVPESFTEFRNKKLNEKKS